MLKRNLLLLNWLHVFSRSPSFCDSHLLYKKGFLGVLSLWALMRSRINTQGGSKHVTWRGHCLTGNWQPAFWVFTQSFCGSLVFCAWDQLKMKHLLKKYTDTHMHVTVVLIHTRIQMPWVFSSFSTRNAPKIRCWL